MTFLLLLTLQAAPAAPASATDVRAAMRRYYEGEFGGGYAWSTSGGLSVAAGVPMVLSREPLLQAMAVPTLVIGAAQVALGVASFFSAPARIRRFDALLDTDPKAFREAETPRLHGVARAFTVFQLTELAIVAGASGLMGAGFARRDDVMLGVGLGLVVQSLLFLVLDEVASRRADTYVTALDDFLP